VKALLIVLVAGALLASCNKNKEAAQTAADTQTAPPSQTASATPVTPAAENAPAPKPVDLVGKPAPEFTLTAHGKEYKLADYKGKTVVLDWFNWQCPAVKAYYDKPEFVKTMNAALAGKDDVVWLSIKSAGEGKDGYDPDETKKFAASIGKTNPILSDATGATGHSYNAQSTPTVFVINPEGVVVYAGVFDEATSPSDAPKGQNLAIAAVEAARAGKAPLIANTKTFG